MLHHASGSNLQDYVAQKQICACVSKRGNKGETSVKALGSALHIRDKMQVDKILSV